MGDYIEKASATLLKWGIVAGVVLWSFCAIMALTLNSPVVVIFAIITLVGLFAVVVLTIISLCEIVHAVETYNISKKDKSHYRVRGMSSDDAKWIERLELFGRWLDRKKGEEDVK